MGRSYTTPALADQDAAIVNPLTGMYVELDGQRFDLAGRVSILDTSEMAAAADAALDSQDPEGMAIITKFLKAAFGQQEYRRFYAHTKRNGTPDELVLEIIGDIVEDVEAAVSQITARPTRSPSASSRGPKARGGRTSQLADLRRAGDVHLAVAEDEAADPELAAERAAQRAAKADAMAGSKPARRRRAAPSRVVKLG